MSWVKYHLEHLKKWREAAKAVKRAAEDLGIDAEVYVIGGAAENRLTVLSDIDILICVKKPLTPTEAHEIRKKVLFKAIDDHGLPWDYPVEIHVYSDNDCKNILEHTKKAIKV